eukprot:TRINITY_DN161_c0_g2_i2.p1 TRINITY_DN161_c0_g2~~TRINITY_DN161_c0_g2_i2.p1  ORF type:complete len:109 (-),score=47.53 TRINITY_DN161_c0_g2_i2:157-438(-)
MCIRDRCDGVTFDYTTKKCAGVAPQCKPGEYYDAKAKICKKCLSHCKSCQAALICDRCEDDYELSKDKTKCTFAKYLLSSFMIIFSLLFFMFL